jgi:AraC-like DNA-binding protein
VDQARLGTALLDLLTAAFAGSNGAPESQQAALWHQLIAYIEAHLADPDLTPGTLAAAHHVSVRYLHRLFETGGETVAGRIRRRRLERCRHDLLDPALRDRPVAAIGARWGLRNPAHLTRLFREAHGLPPAAYRTTYTVH